MKSTYIILFLLLSSIAFMHAQSFYDIIGKNINDKTFVEINKEVMEYLKKYGTERDYKFYNRWRYYYFAPLNENGHIINNAMKTLRCNTDTSELYLKSIAANNGIIDGWIPLGPNSYTYAGVDANWPGIGLVNCITIDPADADIIYIGSTSGGLWRTTSGGNDWEPLFDGQPNIGISGIVIDTSSPIDNRKIYILTGDGDRGYGDGMFSSGVFVSTNGGLTWQSTGLGVCFPEAENCSSRPAGTWWNFTDLYRGFKLLMHPINYNILFAVFDKGGIFKTTDGAVSWSMVQAGKFCDIEFMPGNSNRMYASTLDGKIYYSSNGGNTWFQIMYAGLPTDYVNRIELAVTPANSNYLYALLGVKAIYLSTNQGNNFTCTSCAFWNYLNIGMVDYQNVMLDIAASPNNANEIFFGSTMLRHSTDQGVSSNYAHCDEYTPTCNYLHRDIHDMVFSGNTIYVGCDGGISKASLSDLIWYNISTGLEITEMVGFGITSSNTNKILFGAIDNGTNRLEFGMAYQVMGGDGGDCIIDPTNDSIFYKIASKTINNGQTFAFYIKPIDAKNKTETGGIGFCMDPNNSQTLYICYERIYKSINGALTWVPITDSLSWAKYCEIIKVAPSNSNYIYVYNGNDTYPPTIRDIRKSTNGGQTWVSILSNLPTEYMVTDLEISPDNKDVVFISKGYLQHDQIRDIYKTSNGGQSWVALTKNGLPDWPVQSIACLHDGYNGLFAGMYSGGVYYINNTMTSWIKVSPGLPNAKVMELEIDHQNNYLYAALYGRGIWRTDILYDCVDNINKTTPHTQSEVLRAGTITSSAVINNNFDVAYFATSSIILQPGFEISTNSYATFDAEVTSYSCGIDYYKSAEIVQPIKGIFTGPMPHLRRINTKNDSISENFQISVLPNPFIFRINVNINVIKDSRFTIELYNLNGVKIEGLLDKNLVKGRNSFYYNLNKITSGIYYLVVTSDNYKNVKKIIKN